jgi:hypothetical protein
MRLRELCFCVYINNRIKHFSRQFGNQRICQYLQFEQLRRIRTLKELQFIFAFENSIADDHIFIVVHVAFAKLKAFN